MSYEIVLYVSRLISIAEETLTEFLSKATGTAVEWVQMPGMKVTAHSLCYHYSFWTLSQLFFVIFKKSY